MRCVSFLSLLFCGVLPAFAQQADSLGGRKLREVEIVARKPEVFAAGSRHTPIDSAFLKNNNAGSLADILQNATAVYIKSYGIASVSFRGTTASQTAVLWNGFNINLPALGQTDFSIIPANSLGSIHLQHGSAGSNFGSSAIGGAVLLSSNTDIKPGLSLNVQQDFGSFGRYFTQIGGSYGFKKANVDASIFRTEAKNNFPFINTFKFGKPAEKQENAATEQAGFTANASWKATDNSRFFFRNWFTSSNFQAQPGMIAANTHARNQNRNLRSMAEWNYRSGWGNTSLKAAYFHDFMQYQDDNLQPADTDIKTYQIQAEQAFIFREKLNINLGAHAQYFAGKVDGYSQPVNEWRNSVFALLRYDLFETLHLNLNWRQAFVQGFNPPPAPTFGLSYAFLNRAKNTLSWKGNITRGYRVPTLNDRYWPPGNENLKPEESWNYETGLVHQFTQNQLTTETELTVYALRVDDWIQWLPSAKDASKWVPVNLKKVHAGGLEFSGKITYHFSDWHLKLNGNYAYTRSVQKATYLISDEPLNRQLVYTPLHTASALAGLGYKTWFLNLNGSFTGERFADAENEIALPAYMLFNVSGSKALQAGKCRFQVIGQINNLTNTVYQNLQYYARPGRNYNLSLRFELN
ncbi:TonB-dependent receptor [Adhaeribacter sp. BT258]|uniref:TonB-dependent receptor n=1 Tax=Adhaeribacter terrigena TaxID=2793070 RepID=A0ABS1BWD8_9BACT|nr:TonB-dependent receptor [Adhaeribacter terrigena]MBK0401364.1 TonB-dependent receptor [Adhaeribacter terrigena]